MTPRTIMHRSTHTIQLAVALLLSVACTRAPEPAASAEPSSDPPPMYTEDEPGLIIGFDANGDHYLNLVPTEGLQISLHVTPIPLHSGTWSFELAAVFTNRLTEGTFAIGPDPIALLDLKMEVADPNWTTDSVCTQEVELETIGPREMRLSKLRWDASLEHEQVVELGLRLCGIGMANDRELRGRIALLDATVDSTGQIANFKLYPVSPPAPQPRR